jgi:hypothetical protein
VKGDIIIRDNIMLKNTKGALSFEKTVGPIIENNLFDTNVDLGHGGSILTVNTN